MKSKKFILLSLIVIFIISSAFSLFADSRRWRNEPNEKLKRQLRTLNDNSYIITARESITGEDLENYWVSDKKTLMGMQLKLFYSMGRIYGYVVFINNANNFAIIDNSNLKLILYNNTFGGGHKTFFLQIRSYKFQKLYLARGDSVIAFPIEALAYGGMFPEGSNLEVKAECFHLKTNGELAVY